MSTIYYRSPQGFGSTDTVNDVPPGADVITLEQYNALWQAVQDDDATKQAAARAEAENLFRAAFKGARAAGLTAIQALAVAQPAGLVPADFDADAEPFTPLHVVYETPLSLPDWAHPLAGSDNVWERVAEVPDLAIGEGGEYRVTLAARGTAGISGILGAAVATVSVAVALNGEIIPGTETLVTEQRKAAGLTLPGLQTGATASLLFHAELQPGDVLQLWASRTSANSAVTQVSSNAGGRTRLVASRVQLSAAVPAGLAKAVAAVSTKRGR